MVIVPPFRPTVCQAESCGCQLRRFRLRNRARTAGSGRKQFNRMLNSFGGVCTTLWSSITTIESGMFFVPIDRNGAGTAGQTDGKGSLPTARSTQSAGPMTRNSGFRIPESGILNFFPQDVWPEPPNPTTRAIQGSGCKVSNEYSGSAFWPSPFGPHCCNRVGARDRCIPKI